MTCWSKSSQNWRQQTKSGKETMQDVTEVTKLSGLYPCAETSSSVQLTQTLPRLQRLVQNTAPLPSPFLSPKTTSWSQSCSWHHKLLLFSPKICSWKPPACSSKWTAVHISSREPTTGANGYWKVTAVPRTHKRDIKIGPLLRGGKIRMALSHTSE